VYVLSQYTQHTRGRRFFVIVITNTKQTALSVPNTHVRVRTRHPTFMSACEQAPRTAGRSRVTGPDGCRIALATASSSVAVGNRPAVGLGTGVDFSRLASACRGHFVGVCLHGVSVDTVALAVVVVVRRLFFFAVGVHGVQRSHLTLQYCTRSWTKRGVVYTRGGGGGVSEVS